MTITVEDSLTLREELRMRKGLIRAGVTLSALAAFFALRFAGVI